MFSRSIIKTDKFLDMSPTAQNLYFHLGMEADDDGFVSSPKTIMKSIGAPDDDMKVLIAKGFIIPFEIGVVVITDWKENNYLRSDRYIPTKYQNELKMLSLQDNSYLRLESGIPVVGVGKDRIGKVRIGNYPRNDVELIKFFFELKGWEYKEGDKQSQIVFRRYLRSAGDLLVLCDNDLSESKECLKKVGDWAKDRELDWSIETVFKKWYDIDLLKPKEKKPHYDNCRIFQKVVDGKWWIIRGGEIKELGYNPRKEEIIWK